MDMDGWMDDMDGWMDGRGNKNVDLDRKIPLVVAFF